VFAACESSGGGDSRSTALHFSAWQTYLRPSTIASRPRANKRFGGPEFLAYLLYNVRSAAVGSGAGYVVNSKRESGIEAVTSSYDETTHLVGHKSEGATAIGLCEKAFQRYVQSRVDVTFRVFGSPNLHVTARRGPLSTRSAVASLSVALEPQSLTRSQQQLALGSCWHSVFFCLPPDCSRFRCCCLCRLVVVAGS